MEQTQQRRQLHWEQRSTSWRWISVKVVKYDYTQARNAWGFLFHPLQATGGISNTSISGWPTKKKSTRVFVKVRWCRCVTGCVSVWLTTSDHSDAGLNRLIRLRFPPDIVSRQNHSKYDRHVCVSDMCVWTKERTILYKVLVGPAGDRYSAKWKEGNDNGRCRFREVGYFDGTPTLYLYECNLLHGRCTHTRLYDFCPCIPWHQTNRFLSED